MASASLRLHPATHSPRPIDADLVARASALKPLLAEHARRTEAERQVVPEVIAALEAAGLFDVIVPRRFAGHGATMATQLAVAGELAGGCMSTAWVQSLVNITTWAASRVPCAAELFAGDEPLRACGVIMPGGVARPAPGGYRVTGQWGFTSGSHHANLFVGGVSVLDEAGDPAGMGTIHVPRGDYAIRDTWHVAGVSGSGSNTVVLDDVFVPRNRLVTLAEIAAAPPGDAPSDRWSLGSALSLVLVGPLLGAARAAAEIVTTNAATKPISYTAYKTGAQSVTSLAGIARARLDIDTASLHAFEAAAYLDGLGAGAERSFEREARLRGQCGYLTAMLRQAMDTLLDVNGAGSFASASALQRHWRDVNVGSRHAFLATNVSLETYGRNLFHLDPVMMMV